jgi:transcriptional regulator with XRE-family HTH domain
MKNDILTRFGNRVRERRKLLNLSQEELASRAGVHRTYIGMVERAEKNVTLRNIEKLATALEIPIDELLKLGK